MSVRGVNGRAKRVMWGLVLTSTQRAVAIETANCRAPLDGHCEAPVSSVQAKPVVQQKSSSPRSRTSRGFFTASVVVKKASSWVNKTQATLARIKVRAEKVEASVSSVIRAHRSDVSILNVGQVVPMNINEAVNGLVTYRKEILVSKLIRAGELRGVIRLLERELEEAKKCLQICLAKEAKAVSNHKAIQAKWSNEAKATYAYLIERGVVA